MAPEHGDVRRGRLQHLRDQQAHAPVADDGDAGARIDGHLLEDAARGGHRLGEHRRLVVHAVRHFVQVDRRQRQILGKRPVVLADADDVAVVAVLLDPPRAPVAVTAADVDLADDALADPGGVRRRRLLDDADELVAGDAGEPGVALEDLEIGAADTGAADADETLARALRRGQVSGARWSRGG